MNNDELDLVETENLIDALYRRLGPYGSVLVVINKDFRETTAVTPYYRGGWIPALGLAGFAYDFILRSDYRLRENNANE